MKQEKKERKTIKFIALYAYMILILLILVTAATYAWFSISRTPRVSDMNLYVNAEEGLELSLDPTADEWTLQLDLRDMVPVTAPLRPITWVDEQQKFYAAAYGVDGRVLPFDRWQPLTDERNANKDTLDGYYIKLTLYARSTAAVKVTLSEAIEVDEGINGSGTYMIGTPIWNEEELEHDDGGLGAQSAVRMGLLLTRVDANGVPTGEDPEFFIYEPNADIHVDGSTGIADTPSITGQPNLIDGEHLIRQGMCLWSESDPVERGVVIHAFGDFESNPTLFTLKEKEIIKIDVYIWLEGQDQDCVSEIRNAQIMANLQFASDPDTQSGLVPIE